MSGQRWHLHCWDLGATPSGEVPAAIWQHRELRDIQLRTGAATWAMFRCSHGAASSKPTRWMSDLGAAAQEPYQGWPCIGSDAFYRGPLPRSCPHGGHALKLIGKDAHNEFKTAGAASYSPELCSWLANLILRSFFGAERLADGAARRLAKPLGTSGSATEASGQDSSDDEALKATAARAGRQHRGPPAKTWWDGKVTDFCAASDSCFAWRHFLQP